ncbi:O-antigen ligase family protein [Microbacteriaceae bacterium 4G12]
MKKLLYMLVSKELYFALFLFAGAFKQVHTKFTFLDLSILGLLLSVALVIIDFIKSPKINKIVIQPLAIYLLLTVLIVFSVFYSSSNVYAMDKTLRFITFTAWAFIGPFFIVKTKEELNRFILYSIFISSIMSYFAIKDLKSLLGNEYIGFVSLNGGSYLSLGRVCGMAILLLILFYIVEEKSLIIKVIAFIGILFNLVALLASGSRMPLVALICMIIYITISSIRIKRKIYIRKGFKLFFSVIVVSILVLSVLAKNGMFDTIIYRFEVLLHESGGGVSAQGRTERYKVAIDLFEENPIMGNGIGGFGYTYNGSDTRGYPHNIFLELMAELGVLGGLVFLLLLIKCIKPYFLAGSKRNHTQYALFIIFLFYFLNANVSGDLNDNRVMFCFLSLLAISNYAFEDNKNKLKDLECITS